MRKYLDAFCVFFWASTPVIVQVSVFATAVFSGRDISAADAFTAIALLDRLIFPMNYFPWIINGFLEARVSALRIRGFLFDREDENVAQITNNYEPPSASTESAAERNQIVSIRDCEFGWSLIKADSGDEDDGSSAETPLLVGDTPLSPSRMANPFVLRINELDLKPGSTYVVCGPVGAGKSSLLLALLGEMPLRSSPYSDPATVYKNQNASRCSYAPRVHGFSVEVSEQT